VLVVVAVERVELAVVAVDEITVEVVGAACAVVLAVTIAVVEVIVGVVVELAQDAKTRETTMKKDNDTQIIPLFITPPFILKDF
jgi:hypothetical protein